MGSTFVMIKFLNQFSILSVGSTKLRLATKVRFLICLLGILLMAPLPSDQVAFVSWFPKHNIWLNCGLSVGIWTHRCEEWYTKQVGAIQDGKPPFKQTDWRELIRYFRKGPKLVHHMNLAAVAYIDTL